jgi:hypothetical protein
MVGLLGDYSRGLAFAVELGIVNGETIDLILSRAGVEGKIIDELVVEEKPAVEEPKVEEKVEEANLSGDAGEVPSASELAEKKEEGKKEIKVEEKEDGN